MPAASRATASTAPADPGGPAVDTRNSPAARLRGVPVGGVRLNDAFWAPRREAARAGLFAQYEQLERTGRLANLRNAGMGDGAFTGIRFDDSDVYKWVEAACWALAERRDERLSALVAHVVELIEGAQHADGYVNSYYTLVRPDARWEDMNHSHQLYLAGHLMQAAVAYHRAGLGERLLDVARRFADLICATFGPAEDGKLAETDGHPEIELALVELYRETGDHRYLDQARFFVDVRRGLGLINDSPHPHLPFVEYETMAGHAVCHAYLNSGVTDLYAETGEESYLATLRQQWASMVAAQSYVTGGVGSRHDGEAFGRDHELPNERAYSETCASIASAMWQWRMMLVEGDTAGTAYADVLETTLYNAVLAGPSLTGDTHFYVNPLADDGTHRRKAWYPVACCPPNIARTMAALPGWMVTTSEDGGGSLWLHLYAAGKIVTDLPDGRRVELNVDTTYPWQGEITATVGVAGDYSLRFRIPAWVGNAGQATLRVEPADGSTPEHHEAASGTYAGLRRTWSAGDVVRLSLPMRPRFVRSHPHILENAGRIALLRGPLVYCCEGVDNPDVDLRDEVVAEPGNPGSVQPCEVGGFPESVVALRIPATVREVGAGWSGAAYRACGADERALSNGGGGPNAANPGATTERSTSSEEDATRTAIAVPYYAWANRDPGQLQMWLLHP